jgi:hypothetical protein
MWTSESRLKYNCQKLRYPSTSWKRPRDQTEVHDLSKLAYKK